MDFFFSDSSVNRTFATLYNQYIKFIQLYTVKIPEAGSKYYVKSVRRSHRSHNAAHPVAPLRVLYTALVSRPIYS